MVKHHHEFFDGSGYPDGLTGSGIPLGARILAIADAYDTITSDRTYKKARAAEEAFAELERCDSAQFDPDLVEVFIRKMRLLPYRSEERRVGKRGSVRSYPDATRRSEQ